MDTFRRNLREFDFTLVGVLILLAVYSCTTLYATSVAPGSGNSWLKQSIFEVIGIIVMLAVALYDYRTLRKIRWWMYGISIVLLGVVFLFPAIRGAHSWINLKIVNFQPSELAKLALIILLASYMASVDEQELPSYGLKHLLPLGAMMIIPFVLIFEEPALGQALVVFAIFMVMFIMFTKRRYFLVFLLILVAIVVGLAIVATQYPLQAQNFIEHVLIKHHILKAYQADRILTWLNPNFSISYHGFNVHEARIAIGSGQVFGEGLLGGIITNGGYVPNQTTDYIFTAVGEEFGFVGSAVLIFLYLVLVYRLIRIASSSQDTFGAYYTVGLVAMIGFQVFENIGADMYLSPSTGITLPFLSYGGSSLLINYISMGLVLSVALRRKGLRFSRS